MKINAKQIGFNKPFNIKPSVKNYTKANEMLIKVLKLSANQTRDATLQPDNPKYADFILKTVEQEQSVISDGLQFLQEIFKLNDKQVEHVEESIPGINEFANYLSYVIQRIKGMSDGQIKTETEKERKRQNQDPKK